MQLKKIIKEAIKEDLGKGDITTDLVIKEDKKIKSVIIAEESGIFCGEEVLNAIAEEFNLTINSVKDRNKINNNQKIITIEGNAKDILSSERLILNFITLLSGISTETNKFVEKVKDVKILDTRKTIPLLRELQKYAVKVGGGNNHRQGLYEMVLIKDNHKVLVDIDDALERVKDYKVEIECDNIEEVKKALKHKVDIIMLDNMNISDMKKAVEIIRNKSKQIIIEASGGVNLDNVGEIAKTGVNCISIGSITSNVKPLKMKMEIV